MLQTEFRVCGTVDEAYGNGASEAQGQAMAALGLEDHFPVPLPGLMLGPRVVETGIADHAEVDLATNGLGPAHEAARLISVIHHGHEIGDFGHAFAGEEARQQDVGLRQVELLVPGVVQDGSDLEMPALAIVQDRRERGRRIKVGAGEEVDRAVHAHQRRGAHVADDSVVLDRLISHESRSGPSLPGESRSYKRAAGSGGLNLRLPRITHSWTMVDSAGMGNALALR